MKLRSAKRKYELTFEQCRKVIKLFIKGLSVDKMAYMTGLRKSKIIEVLFLTRELLARERKLTSQGLLPY